jgi:hypothetical protein
MKFREVFVKNEMRESRVLQRDTIGGWDGSSYFSSRLTCIPIESGLCGLRLDWSAYHEHAVVFEKVVDLADLGAVDPEEFSARGFGEGGQQLPMA